MVLVGPRIASIRRVFERAWGHVRWKMVAIIILMGSSTVLFAGLAVVIVNVVVRRENANVAEKQIQTLVQASGSIASAVLDNVDGCSQERVNSGELKPLLAYTSEAFPGARMSLRMEDSRGTQLLPPQTNASVIAKPDWLQQTVFTGLVADNGQLEIRDVAESRRGECTVTAVFQVPLWTGFGTTVFGRRQFENQPGPAEDISRTRCDAADVSNGRFKLCAGHRRASRRGAEGPRLEHRRGRRLDRLHSPNRFFLPAQIVIENVLPGLSARFSGSGGSPANGNTVSKWISDLEAEWNGNGCLQSRRVVANSRVRG